MRWGFFLKQTLIIICFVELSFERNVMLSSKAQIEKINEESNHKSYCCSSERRNETEVKPGELGFLRKYKRYGGKYRIPVIAKTTEKSILLAAAEITDGKNYGDLETGFEDHLKRKSEMGNFSLPDSTPANGNNSILRKKKRPRKFSRKNFTRKNYSKSGRMIYLLGLFDLHRPKTGTNRSKFEDGYEIRPEGMSEYDAAYMAIKHVNQRKLINGYQLELYWNDTKSDPGVAVNSLFYALFSKNVTIPVVLGSACSLATISLASITQYWDIVQISFGATSPVLSNRNKFRLFYRVAAPDSSHNAAKLAFVRHFGWNTVTFISQNEKEYILTANNLIQILERNNITCKGTVTFGKNNFQDQLQHLKDMDTRIIFGSFSEEIAPKIFCKVYELGVYGANYAWILQGDGKRQWWKNQLECPDKNIYKVVQGIFFISSYHDYESFHSFQPNFSRRDLLRELLQKNNAISQYAYESYDAIWTAAIALNESLRIWSESKSGMEIEDFNYDRHDMASTIFKKISRINFIGVSGPILFEGADRLGTSAFYQMQGDFLKIVAIFLPTNKILNFSCDGCRGITWEGGQVPVSQRFLLQRVETISFEAFLAVACITFIAILLAILFLIFNSYFRKLKNIKLSSPKLNNIAVVGCIAVYIGVFLLGLDYATLPNINYYSFVCTAKVYFFAAGFSLAFGSIFAKTYRVHKIFIKSQGGFMKKKILQDRQLILLIGVLLLLDGLILTVWVVSDPLQRQLYNSTIEYSSINRSVMFQAQIEICSCNHLNSWLSFLYMYKGLQLLMGVFLAWETRHVKIPGLNDSQYIVLSVYSVVITSCIVVVLANLIFERPTIAYLIISTMIISSTTATLCLLFFPKVKVIFSKSVNNLDPIMQSMGLILESSTRRFLTDDAKEKLYRLEVQNRVYKKETFTLGNEISRLEKELLSNFCQEFKILNNTCHMHSSLLDISTDYDRGNPNHPFKYLTRSWPNEMHKITQFNRSQSLNFEFRVRFYEKSLPTKNVTYGKKKMKSFLRSTMNPMKKKEPNGVMRNDQRKSSISHYLPYVQKTVYDVKLNEDVNIWGTNKEKNGNKSKTRRKSQPPSKIRFKGSPRFPHRIVPISFFISDIDKETNVNESKILDDFESKFNEENKHVITHQVEVLVSSENEGNRLE